MYTSIQITKDFLEELKKQKQIGESYEQLIRRLINSNNSNFQNNEIEERLNLLEKRIIQLENNIMNRIQNVIFKLDHLDFATPSKKIEEKEPEIKVIESKTDNKQLPSFLANNPWVEILRRRGIEVEPE